MLRQQRNTGGNPAPRARHKARRAGILVGLGRLGDKRFMFCSGKDRDFSTRRTWEKKLTYRLRLQRGSSRERFGVA